MHYLCVCTLQERLSATTFRTLRERERALCHGRRRGSHCGSRGNSATTRRLTHAHAHAPLPCCFEGLRPTRLLAPGIYNTATTLMANNKGPTYLSSPLNPAGRRNHDGCCNAEKLGKARRSLSTAAIFVDQYFVYSDDNSGSCLQKSYNSTTKKSKIIKYNFSDREQLRCRWKSLGIEITILSNE